MSVLVEAIGLVVPRIALDLRFPGGTDGFLAELAHPSSEHRHFCLNEDLVSVSYSTPDACDRAALVLVNAGMVEVADCQFQELAIVDQFRGPILQCQWLVWSRDPAGYTCAWLAGRDRGELAAPEGWSADQSRRLSRFGSPSASADVLRLGEENGADVWLDFRSGRVITSHASGRFYHKTDN